MYQAVKEKPVSRLRTTAIPETFTGNSGTIKEIRIFGEITGKELDPETGMYYFGARYLDPRTSRWISADPAMAEYIPQAPINDEAKKYNKNLPGMGGIFNVVNMHAYHYAGNNPIKLIDPDGRTTVIIYIWNENAGWNSIGGGAHVALYVSNPGISKNGEHYGQPALYDPSGSYSLSGSRPSSGVFYGYEDSNLENYINYHLSEGATVTLYILDTSREQEANMLDLAFEYKERYHLVRMSCAKDVSAVLKEIGGTQKHTPLGVKIQMEAWESIGKAEKMIITNKLKDNELVN